jgi:hypothetical protein
MTCTQCGRALDAQALELGACRYCGQAIASESKTVQNTSPGDPAHQQAFPDLPTQSRYGWEDWPATNGPPPGAAGGTGNTSPTLLRPDQSPAPFAWNDPGSDNDALTQFGPRSFISPDPYAPAAAAPPGTIPFGASPPAPNTPPAGAGLPQPGTAAPAQHLPAAPARKSRGKALMLAIVGAILLIAVIGGGLLFARSFNTASPSAGTGVSSSPNPTAPATPSPTATPTPIPTSTYRDPSGLFSLQYPSAWTPTNFSPSGNALPLPLNGVRFSSGQAEFVVLTGQELPGLPNNGLAEQADDALLNSMNAHNISSARPVSIGGQTWTEKSADTDGGKHTVIASISFKGHLYSLWYSAPASEFNADETHFFSPMIASFRFGA